MKKHINRMLALLLVCAVFCSMVISVSAAEVGENEYYIQETRATSNLPFAMVASQVKDYVDTVNSGKSFSKNDVTSYVTTYGKLYSTLSSGTYKAGICYYVNGKVVYHSNLSVQKTSGDFFDLAKAKSYLSDSYTYYAFADNLASTSYYVHGTVSVDQY